MNQAEKGTYGSTRVAFGEALVELAQEGVDVVAVAADTSKSMGLYPLRDLHPERMVDVGIAEQVMVLVAAGLAADGKVAFATSYSAFTSTRSLEQFRTFAAYPGLNVNIVAGLSGFTAGIEGPTHIALDDVGIIRSIPNVTLVNPSDAITAKELIRQVAMHPGPTYTRVGRDESPNFYSSEVEVQLGRAIVVDESGRDLTIVSTGPVLGSALSAFAELKKRGVGCRLLDVHTIKPLDEAAILAAAEETGALIVVEDSTGIGGLRGAVAEFLANHRPSWIAGVSVGDRFTESATPDELSEAYGVTADAVVRRSQEVLASL